MLALAATVITGSAFAQVDTTKKDTSMPQTDTTTHPKKDKKKTRKLPLRLLLLQQKVVLIHW